MLGNFAAREETKQINSRRTYYKHPFAVLLVFPHLSNTGNLVCKHLYLTCYCLYNIYVYLSPIYKHIYDTYIYGQNSPYLCAHSNDNYYRTQPVGKSDKESILHGFGPNPKSRFKYTTIIPDIRGVKLFNRHFPVMDTSQCTQRCFLDLEREYAMPWLEWGGIIHSCNFFNSRLQLRKTDFLQVRPGFANGCRSLRKTAWGISVPKVHLPSPSWRQRIPAFAFQQACLVMNIDLFPPEGLLIKADCRRSDGLPSAGGSRMHYLGAFCSRCWAHSFLSPTMTSHCQGLPMLRVAPIITHVRVQRHTVRGSVPRFYDLISNTKIAHYSVENGYDQTSPSLCPGCFAVSSGRQVLCYIPRRSCDSSCD